MTQGNRWIFAIWAGIAVITIVLVYVAPTRGSKMGLGLGTQFENAIVGTSSESSRLPTLSSNDETVHALEQMTRAKNERELIGKRITVKATPEQFSSTTYWADIDHDAHVLALISRDQRNARDRYFGDVEPTDFARTPDRPVELSGTIQRLPKTDGRWSWGLYDDQHGQLPATVYLRIDRQVSAAPSPQP